MLRKYSRISWRRFGFDEIKMNLTAFAMITLWKIPWWCKPVSGAMGRLCSLLQTAEGMFWAWHQAPEIWWHALITVPHSVTPHWELESATMRNQQMPQMCKVYQPGQFFSREAVVKPFSSTQAAAGRAWVYSTPAMKGPRPLWLAAFRGKGWSSGEVDCRLPPSVSSAQFSHSLSDSLQPHELQHARLPCPSPTPRAYSNSCP